MNSVTISRQQAERLLQLLLADPEGWGISEEAYGMLLELFIEPLEINELRHSVDATDGRFYIPKED